MKKTTEEMGQLIISLQEIFDVVRLINPTQLEPCIENALSGSNEKRHDYCFRSFQKDQRARIVFLSKRLRNIKMRPKSNSSVVIPTSF